ncbi:3beta-hydroxysteroid 3-dehydrogenase [Malassezia cuniculi]|uniref:3beta-hydroxysteroid 3-dehydrogenase n=1 Tax=Malassezia cuniculi TaxID=948313 RepID=A0AAF0ER88_9BASI|nr:3beta-hydroxysteroid 3-dehydrogenase [Malassezia cuniculi]
MRPIILVTGANGGVGLGVCERLLVQLSSPTPPDSSTDGKATGTPYHAAEGCTLVLACRNPQRAAEAKAHLEHLLQRLGAVDDSELARGVDPAHWTPQGASSAVASAASAPAARPRYTQTLSAPVPTRDAAARDAYRASFVRGTVIDTVSLDLASAQSTIACASELARRYPYLTHMILNAGGASWIGVDWLRATFSMLVNLHAAVTRPTYKLQRSGEVSADGYGKVWELNVGMHYVLANRLRPLLCATPYNSPSRIIWTGSLEAAMRDYHEDDMECLDPAKSPHAYESTKYQCELAALGMDDRLRGAGTKEPRVYTAHPGIVASSIFAGVIYSWMLVLMRCVFYLARWTGSPHHPIDAYKGAVAASHVAIAPVEALDSTVRYGARCTIFGREYVTAEPIDGWDGPPSQGMLPHNTVGGLARRLVERCDARLQAHLAD